MAVTTISTGSNTSITQTNLSDGLGLYKHLAGPPMSQQAHTRKPQFPLTQVLQQLPLVLSYMLVRSRMQRLAPVTSMAVSRESQQAYVIARSTMCSFASLSFHLPLTVAATPTATHMLRTRVRVLNAFECPKASACRRFAPN